MSSHASRKVSRKATSTDTAIEEVSRNKAKTQEQKLDRSISYREAIEGLGTFSINPPSYQESVEIEIRKKFGSSTNNQVSGGVEIA